MSAHVPFFGADGFAPRMADPSALVPPHGEVRLRPYQTEAIDRLDIAVARGVRRVLVVAPTGAGKTTIAAFIILRAIARESACSSSRTGAS